MPPCARALHVSGGLIVVAVCGILMAATGVSWHTLAQREKESELLSQVTRSGAPSDFITSVARRLKAFPRRWKTAQDKRYPATQRYLRKIYRDPISGKADWGLVDARAAASWACTAARRSRVQRGALPSDDAFKDRSHYSDGASSIPGRGATTQPFSKPRRREVAYYRPPALLQTLNAIGDRPSRPTSTPCRLR